MTMGLRFAGAKYSFDILSSMDAYPETDNYPVPLRRSLSDIAPGAVIPTFPSEDISINPKRRHKKKKKKKQNSTSTSSSSSPMKSISEIGSPLTEETLCGVGEGGNLNLSCRYFSQSGYGGAGAVASEEITVNSVSPIAGGELRQRHVGGGGGCGISLVSSHEPSSTIAVTLPSSWVGERELEKENGQDSFGMKPMMNEHFEKLNTVKSLDWKQLVVDDPNNLLPLETSPLRYFKEELSRGNSLSSTTTIANDKERERVYNTILRLPWRCEWLIDVGFLVCLNSFLSLLTVMPARIWMTGRRLVIGRQCRNLSTADLSDFSCLVVLIFGVVLLGQTDISLIYHMIRGQGTIKLYVVYNVMEIFDKMWQSFGGDIMETLFKSADGLVHSSPESFSCWIERYIIDLVVAAVSSAIHSFILLVQAITLSTCIVAHNNALLALLVSNNFAEIKGNVFKRFSKDNVHQIVYSDSIERFHIAAYLSFVFAQNILEAEGPWFQNFLDNAILVFLCEMVIDIIKHSFIAKFNDIKPIAYSEFLEELCRQTLNSQSECGKKHLTFVPLAPACVVIRILTPVYAAQLPCGPLFWRFFWMAFLIVLTSVMLASLKLLIGMGLQRHAAWYIRRCESRKLHSD